MVEFDEFPARDDSFDIFFWIVSRAALSFSGGHGPKIPAVATGLAPPRAQYQLHCTTCARPNEPCGPVHLHCTECNDTTCTVEPSDLNLDFIIENRQPKADNTFFSPPLPNKCWRALVVYCSGKHKIINYAANISVKFLYCILYFCTYSSYSSFLVLTLTLIRMENDDWNNIYVFLFSRGFLLWHVMRVASQ